MERVKKHLPIIIFLVAFAYYAGLSAKEYTWIFVSGDSGDWLAASTWWMVPQPMGSPLYILLGRFLNLFPGDLVLKMTLLLSCLPSAITVTLVYMIVRRLIGRVSLALVSAGVLLGAGVFLTQSTVLEQYASAVMLLTLAYWFYISGRRKLTALSLGLATAIHIVVLPIVVLWLFVERREWRAWGKAGLVFVAAGIGPYALIPAIMATDAPPLLAGHLSLQSLTTYWGSTANHVVGTSSIFELPKRLGMAGSVLIGSIGLGLVPIARAFWKPVPKHILVLIATIGFSLWFHITSLDPVSWTFLNFAMPSLAILVGIGLTRLKKQHVIAVSVGAMALVMANSLFLNAHVMAQQRQDATIYQSQLEEMPEGSAVVVYCGHYSLGLFYAMSEGRTDLAPIIFLTVETGDWPDYEEWLEEEYGITGRDTRELAICALSQGRDVYVAGDQRMYDALNESKWGEFTRCFDLDGDGSLREVVGFSGSWVPPR